VGHITLLDVSSHAGILLPRAIAGSWTTTLRQLKKAVNTSGRLNGFAVGLPLISLRVKIRAHG
jgi:hypothetical protein